MEVVPTLNAQNAGESDKLNDALTKQTDCLISENSLSIVNIINNNEERELSICEPTWLEGDEPMAVWVKLNEKWQAAIKCERADWPLLTLKEKPANDGKKYFLIYYPSTSCFSWVDMLLIRPINEFPQPNEFETHIEGLEMANNLTAGRLFLLQNLTIRMMSIVDLLHSNALVEAAQNVIVWQQFAMEASQCYGYSHLGRMLLMLKNSIVQQYINVEWLLHSNNSWVKRCQNANTAEAVELLKEELFDSILWTDVNALWGAPAQANLASEWETWRQDVGRWFSSYSPFSTRKDMLLHKTSDAFHQPSYQLATKRAKLMVRRPNTQQIVSLQTDPGFSQSQDLSRALVVAETSKEQNLSIISCGGITIAGTHCKHRSVQGFSFCRKHWHPSTSSRSTRKRKSLHNNSSICKEIVPVNAETPLQAIHGDYLLGDSVWGFNRLLPSTINNSFDSKDVNKCMICSDEFPDDEALGNHWMENHKKELHWLFKGYACGICLDSFPNKEVLEKHVSQRHNAKFVEQCLLLQCIPCSRHLGDMEELWLHVMSAHLDEFKPPKVPQRRILTTNEDSPENFDKENEDSLNENSKKPGGLRKFTCKHCGLKFTFLHDLDRHHQAVHMEGNQDGRPLGKRTTGIRFRAQRFKSGRVSRPNFKIGVAESSHKIKSRENAKSKRCVQEAKLLEVEETAIQPHANETNIGELTENQKLEISRALFSGAQISKPRLQNLDILSIAKSACCKISLKASLEDKYGTMPDSMYLKAVKVCSEHDIAINWHNEGFICPRGCNLSKDQRELIPLESLSNGLQNPNSVIISDPSSNEIEQDESHCVVNSTRLGSSEKAVVLYDDSVVDKENSNFLCSDGTDKLW